MSSAAQVLRQAEALKASVSDSNKGISETWVARQRLEDLYKKLLLMDLEYALDKKVEQDLWNHAFKNHINSLQSQTKDKQNPKRGETQATLNLFLETASGFYLQLLQLVCTTFKLDLPFRRKSSCFGILKEKIPLKVKITPPKKSSCLYICQHCLVHLGDIARYRQQIEQAQTYYWHAANLLPFNGQPYNQLAIVEAAYGNKLSTVFYYIRSLAVRHPFPVAATNLEKLYNKLAKDPCELKGKLSVSEMITAFLQFQAFIHMCVELQRAELLSEKLVAALPAHVTSQSFPSGILVQIIAINIFAMQHARRQLSSDTEDLSNGHLDENLTVDEETSFQLMFKFTILVLDVLLQYTPKQEQKLRDFFTLPAVKLLLDWFKLNPEHLYNPVLKTSSLWVNLCKVLNNIRPPSAPKDGKHDIGKYEDLPLTEDAELRCFQPLEKAHSGFSFSRVPSEGLPSEVESQLRCRRLLAHGHWIAEEYPGLNLMNIQANRIGKVQFTAPSAPVKVVTAPSAPVKVVTAPSAPVKVVTAPSAPVKVVTAPSKVIGTTSAPVKVMSPSVLVKTGTTAAESQTFQSSPERKPVRQNVAIQAIIQKQSQTSKDQSGGEKVVTKIQQPADKVKAVESVGGKLCSPKYILGVPTSEPLFMKPSGGRPSTGGPTGTGRPPTQTPPRLQKQHQLQLAQQQMQTHLEEEEEMDEEEKMSWQPLPEHQKTSQEQTGKQTKVGWQLTSQQSAMEASPQLLTTQQTAGYPLVQTDSQFSPNTPAVSPGQQAVSPLQHPRMASPHPAQSPKPVMILQPDFRSSPRKPVNPQQEDRQQQLQQPQQQNHSTSSPSSEFDIMGYTQHIASQEGGPVRGGSYDPSMVYRTSGPGQPNTFQQDRSSLQGQIQGQGHDGASENMDVRVSQHQRHTRSHPAGIIDPNMPYVNSPSGASMTGDQGNNARPPSQQGSQVGNQFSRSHPPPNMNMYYGQQSNIQRPVQGSHMNPTSGSGADRIPGAGGPPKINHINYSSSPGADHVPQGGGQEIGVSGMDNMGGGQAFQGQSNRSLIPGPIATHPQQHRPPPQQNHLQPGPSSQKSQPLRGPLQPQLRGPPPPQNQQQRGPPPQHNQQQRGPPTQQNQQQRGPPPQHNQQQRGPPPQHNQQQRGPPPQHNQQQRGPPPQHNQQQRGPPPQHTQQMRGHLLPTHPSHSQSSANIQGQPHPSHPQPQQPHPQSHSHPHQPHPHQQTQQGVNPSYQGPMFNPINFLAGISRFNLGNQNFGNMEGLDLMRQNLKKEDLPPNAADILGALSLLAVQPPRGMQDTLMVPNRHTSFQGHAEGTPKPDSSSPPCRSPLLTPEMEPRPSSQVTMPSSTSQQLGTYTLFSSSPWSVPLSTADTKSLASSPFSSESNSMRNSPDPALDMESKSASHGFEMGLRFGPNEDHNRREKMGQPIPHPEVPPPQEQGGPGPFFPSTFQSIWSSGNSAGQSPLERLLEKQKRRQNDPH
ncbi:nonsense-mediated mRNA decay factor SMG7-like [Ylistrum balloti]|uniref:nonsense-mediated mRNA decay factor SMG7-like n=1 Tax=Ylistrum balloti TaxID=509963 RepID=UPI0029058EDA|nr:nonsense-mediated mRNA decay factor SMG7-like [Ylistrum balloti]